jgi:hypothetical protein
MLLVAGANTEACLAVRDLAGALRRPPRTWVARLRGTDPPQRHGLSMCWMGHASLYAPPMLLVCA